MIKQKYYFNVLRNALSDAYNCPNAFWKSKLINLAQNTMEILIEMQKLQKNCTKNNDYDSGYTKGFIDGLKYGYSSTLHSYDAQETLSDIETKLKEFGFNDKEFFEDGV